ncbi:MAG: hypothetical protein M1829_003023 [Trizodia sp. TS-e1964]|nr:MAG: hypothetical protein M1829_003023 [Trizodia sp. TS-e1964]
MDERGITMDQSGSGNTQQSSVNGNIYSSVGGRMFNAHQQIFTNENPWNEESTKESCLSGLFLTDPKADREKLVNAKGKRVDGTCKWINTHQRYQELRQSTSQLLWISGGPGMGKSMFAIFLAEELEQIAKNSQNTSFLQYFCDNKDEKRNTAVAILRGLIYQILQLHPGLVNHILPTFKIQRESMFSCSSLETLWSIFQSMICEPILGPIYCILDGLDECENPSIKLKLIVLSREHPEFISHILSSFPRIRLDPNEKTKVNQDIDRFINIKVEELSALQNYPTNLSTHVKEVFQSHAKGTFLWIGIVAETLQKYKATEVVEALGHFPPGLDGLYARMLLQIDPMRQQMAARILRWVVMAIRPLTLSELSIAVKVTVDPSLPLSRKDIIKDCVSFCGNFLAVEADEVRLIHQSAKDYLLRETPDSDPVLEIFRVKKYEANLEIARKCFFYLQSGALADGPVNLKEKTTRLVAFPFLSYAAIYWPRHSRTLLRSEDIFDLSLPFYNKKLRIRKRWLQTYKAMYNNLIPPSLAPLNIASIFGILPLAQNLLLKDGMLNKAKLLLHLRKKDEAGMTPLVGAASNGFETVVQLLLDNGANIEASDKRGATALMVAASGGHRAVVQILLDKRANIEAGCRYGQTALIWAASKGHGAVVQILLDKGANIEASCKCGATALMGAALYGDGAMVKLLLDKGANIEAKNKYRARQLTSSYKSVEQVILVREANSEAFLKDGASVLMWAASRGHGPVVQLLLDKGANIEASCRSGQTALIWAASKGHGAVVQILLDKGANIEASCKCGATSLMEAALYGDGAVVKLLLDKGANIERGLTALSIAASYKHKAAVLSTDSAVLCSQRGAQGGNTTNASSNYTGADEPKNGELKTVPCKRWTIRITKLEILPGFILHATSRRSTVCVWDCGIRENHKILELESLEPWSKVARCHNTLLPPKRSTSGEGFRYVTTKAPFPALSRIESTSMVGDALVSHPPLDGSPSSAQAQHPPGA